MNITPEQLEKYRAMLRAQFGRDLTEAEMIDAQKSAYSLVKLVEQVYRPIQKKMMPKKKKKPKPPCQKETLL